MPMMNTPSPTKTRFTPFLITGVTAGILSAWLDTAYSTPVTFSTFFASWVNFYSLMFLFAYKEAATLRRALLITLIPSLLATLPCFWTTHHFYTSSCLLFLSAYALNAFHLHYQRHTFSTLHYSTLFYGVWDTFASLLITLFFTLLCWILLGICAGLFSIVDITFLKTLLLKGWFETGITTFFICTGLYIPAQANSIVRNVRTILLLICRYLLIPLAVIAILFIVLLVFHGHQKTLSHSAQYLFFAIAFLSVLFLNGVYQDGMNEKEYPRILKLICRIFIIITPIFSLLAIRGIFLGPDNGIQQNGINTNNFYSLVNGVILFAYTLWYAITAVNSKPHWLKSIEKANVILAAALIATTLVVSMPLIYHALPKQPSLIHTKPTSPAHPPHP